MNFLELQDLALTWLDDTQATYFTRPQIKVWLNNAQREAQKLMLNAGEDYYTVCVYTNTVINQKYYALPSDFLKVMRMDKVMQGSGDTAQVERMYPMTRNEQDLLYGLTNPGEPCNYVINKNTFGLFPTPNLVREVHLWYAYRVQDMVNDIDQPDLPIDYHEYIAIMAARDGFLRDGRDMTTINIKLGYFEKMLKENAEDRDQSSPRQVVCTDWEYT